MNHADMGQVARAATCAPDSSFAARPINDRDLALAKHRHEDTLCRLAHARKVAEQAEHVARHLRAEASALEAKAHDEAHDLVRQAAGR
jgi:hypothetical protein